MIEPALNPDASAAIDEYALSLARRSQLPFGLAEDARRELAAHVTDLARERPRTQGRARVDLDDVRHAIGAMGNDAGVLGAFFQSGGPATTTVTYGRALLLVLAILAGISSLFAFIITVSGIEFEGLLVVLPTFAAAAFGATAVWMLPARWSIIAAAVVLTLPLLLYTASGAEDDLLFWIVPATFMVLGGIARSQVPTGAQPVSRLAFDVQPYVRMAARNWRRVGHVSLAVATVLVASVAFIGFADHGFWVSGVGMLALAFTGVYLLGRTRPWVPFLLACILFVGSLALYDFYYSLASNRIDQFKAGNVLNGAYAGVLLALASLFVGAFPSRRRPASNGAPAPT